MTIEELTLLIEEEDKVISLSDARDFFGGCIPGWQVFAETHNFEWKSVVRYGLKASELVATNDAMALSLVEYKYNG
jgi:hypothetical protein